MSERDQERAWRYFEIHANHRLTIFNYFLILAGLLAAGIGASVQSTGHLRLVGIALGFILVLVSFVFWKLDQRASFFIKRAETALAQMESELSQEAFQLFLSEPTATCQAKKDAPAWNPHWTYGQSLRCVFVGMGLFGIVGGVFSLCRFTGWLLP